MPSHNWFEALTGFVERDYDSTQNQLAVQFGELISRVNGKRYAVGELTLPTLAELRTHVDAAGRSRTTVDCVAADARALHSNKEFEGALFQVASQFNLLEMVGPSVRPDDGVARYASDHTQGPACAMACGAATIYRNYFAPVGDHIGQTGRRQLDTLSNLGSMFSQQLSRPVTDLWTMSNGYAMCSPEGLSAIAKLLERATDQGRDDLRGALRIGFHRDVEVTDVTAPPRRLVSQAFCSALPVAYSPIPQAEWESFARLVLEAAYEATMLLAARQAASAGSATLLLTRLGGGAFGNAGSWIDDAIVRALRVVENAGLDVHLVSYGSVDPSMQAIADRWAG